MGQPGNSRRDIGRLLRLLGLVVLLGAPRLAAAQDGFDPTRPRDPQGAILPDTPLKADLEMKALRATTWDSGGTRRVLLDRDARIAIGSYGFKADGAVVYITPSPERGGPTQLAIYLDNVTELGGHGPINAEARRLLITALIQGRVKLAADRLVRKSAEGEALVQAANARLQRHYRALSENIIARADQQPLYPRDVFAERVRRQSRTRGEDVPPLPEVVIDHTPPVRPGPDDEPDDAPPLPPEAKAPPDAPDAPDRPADDEDEDARRLRLVQFNAGRIVYQEGEDESYALLVGDVRVMYHDPDTRQGMSLAADRAVIFTAPGALTGQQADVRAVRGVYLEGNVVATNGEYTLRGPRVFYDLQTDRAVVLEAVFFTWDIKRQVPIYVRAEKIMQTAQNQWRAHNATLSTSEFAEPHFALGVGELTIDRERSPEGDDRIRYQAEDLTMRTAGVPVFYWPGVSGTAADSPLRRLSVNFDGRDGMVVRSRWDLFALADRQAPEGVDLELIGDAYTNRGGAIGFDMNYNVPKAFGNADGYLMYDAGDDEPGGREEVEPEDNLRGMGFWQHRHDLPDNWEVSAEVGYISDPTFLEEFFPDRASTDKPWETSLYAKKQEEDWAFTFLTKFDLLDFVPQLTQLQTPGYTVDKLPELAYYRLGTSLFGDAVTWFSENRASLMRINLPEQTPRELGFNMAESVALFGMANTTRFDAALSAAGLNEDEIYRFDSRQELNLPLKVGPIDVVPYLTGRVTLYEEDFSSFSGEDENVRWWGQAGVKLHTTFTNTYDGAESRLLDVHRLRHIIEPSVHAGYAWTNIEQQNLPVFDFDVESLAEGHTIRLGLRNTFQTQRGGPGNWRSVDWLRIDTDLVIQDDDTVRESPLPRFFDYRPEFSLAGDHFWGEVAWQVTDTLHTVGNVTWSFDSDQMEQWNFGLTYDHNPRLSSFAQLRRIESVNSLIFSYGFDYLLSAKYHVSFSQSLDLENNETRDVSVLVTRRLPRMLVTVAVAVDPLGGDTSFGISFTPEGVGGGRPGRNPFTFAQ